MTTERVLFLLRARLKEPLQDVDTDTSAYTSPDVELSNDNLKEMLHLSYKELASYVKVQHIPEINLSSSSTTLPADMLRLLDESVLISSNIAVFRTPKATRLLSEGRGVALSNPVYTVIGNTINPTPVAAMSYRYVGTTGTDVGDVTGDIIDAMVPLVIAKTLSTIYRHRNNHEVAEYYFQLYQAHLLYFQRGYKFSTFPDKEVEVEYDH